jgi:DNA-binding transcriptional ArsR family regulator
VKNILTVVNATALHVVDRPATAATLLDPTRLEILRALDQPDSAAGLARRLGLPRQKLNYHLRLLEGDGLVELVEERKKRNCTERVLRAVARSYLISPAALGSLAADPDRVADRTSSAYLVATAARAITEVSTAVTRPMARETPHHAHGCASLADDQRRFAEELTPWAACGEATRRSRPAVAHSVDGRRVAQPRAGAIGERAGVEAGQNASFPSTRRSMRCGRRSPTPPSSPAGSPSAPA